MGTDARISLWRNLGDLNATTAGHDSRMTTQLQFGVEWKADDAAFIRRPFGVPPFSVLNARAWYWRRRKEQWLRLIPDDASGRGAVAGPYKDGLPNQTVGASVFDPVLCEIMYRWFCPDGGTIVDPFSGGPTRGIVAALLGYTYIGVDIREEQVAENARLAAHISCGKAPVWHAGDSRDISGLLDGVGADFVFSCPPYGNLEVYRGPDGDLSRMTDMEFAAAYRRIIAASTSLLRRPRFACFVVAEYRNRDGLYGNFVGETVSAFQAAGMGYYNEALYLTPPGTLPMRAGPQFSASRKFAKAHQNVLIFWNGPKGKKPQLRALAQEFGRADMSCWTEMLAHD